VARIRRNVKTVKSRTPKKKSRKLSAAAPSSTDARAELFKDGAIDPRTAARTYGGSEALYRKAMDHGRIPYSRIGTKRLIPKRALLAFLERHLVPARDPDDKPAA
jgi:hypothetical protein